MPYDQTKFYAEIAMDEVRQDTLGYGHAQVDLQKLSGTLKAILETVQPIHVGSGLMVPPEQLGLPASFPLVKEFFRVGSSLRIPGTSLKGAIRSLVEMFTYSCAPVVKYNQREQAHTCRFSEANKKLCPACRVFGILGYQGHVHFDDGKFFKGWGHEIVEIPPQFSYDGHPGKRRYYPHDLSNKQGAAWPLEVIKPGAKFLMQMNFENIAPADLGLISIALGQGEWQLCPKLGAGKNAGLGKVRVVELAVETVDLKRSYTEYTTRLLQWAPQKGIHAAQQQGLLRLDVLEKLRRDLAY